MKLAKSGGLTPCERREHRYPLANAWLEWTDAAGHPWKFQVLDVSRNGVSLGLTVEGAGMKEGAELDGAVLRIEGLEVRGRVIVTQSNESLSRGDVRGGHFHPASIDDEQRFLQVISYLERRARRATVS